MIPQRVPRLSRLANETCGAFAETDLTSVTKYYNFARPGAVIDDIV